jgi:hypothetical protein
VLDFVEEALDEIARAIERSLLSFYGRLKEMNGLGSFMVAQVVADVKYAQLKNARDWATFVAPGPGSKRGLNVRQRSTPVGAVLTSALCRFRLANANPLRPLVSPPAPPDF